MEGSKTYFRSLDVIRLIAATMVVLQHSFADSISHISPKGSFFYNFLSIFCDGSAGVSLFFVLSGFLITYLLIKESEKNGKVNVLYFYTRRVLRIWPLYFTVLILVFLVYPLARGFLNVGMEYCTRPWMYFVFLGNFDLIQVFKHCTDVTLLSQNITWSVAIEEQFYLFWPLVFFIAPKKLWIYVMIGLFGFSIVFKWIFIKDVPVLYFHTFSVLFELVIGSIAAYLTFYNTRFKDFFRIKAGMKFCILVGCIIILKMLGAYEVLGVYSYGVFKSLCSVLFAGLITAQLVLNDQSAWSFSRFSLFSKWGVFTYGIYMLHPIVLNFVSYFLHRIHISQTTLFFGVLQFICCFTLTLFVSFLSYRYFESFFLKLKRKFTLIS